MSGGKCCDLDEFVRAIADETRQRILTLLQSGEMNVGELTLALGLRQPTISHHLALMLRAGLVFRRREGRLAFYRANPACVAECCAGILTRFRIPVELSEREIPERTDTSKDG